MDSTWKKIWIEALRSGNYTQGKQCLRYQDTYCCLGVLASEVSKHYNTFRWSGVDNYELQVVANDRVVNTEEAILPDELVTIVGLDDGNPSIPNEENLPEYMGNPSISLAELNDEEIPFTRIADLIEKYL